ncbi:hypothetical protein AGMMS50256_14780 [Betaproteobacteria bacterium]|nr:hypothetical protein AGMMS50256_14780 [Betaproteobacteria bacterium]
MTILRLLIFKLWPLWVWLGSRWLLGAVATGTEYYRAAQAFAPLLLFLAVHYGAGQEDANSNTQLAAIGSVVSGILGGIDEYGRWSPYLGAPGYGFMTVLHYLDYPLVLISAAALVLPFALLPQGPVEWFKGLGRLFKPGSGAGEGYDISDDISMGSARWMSMKEARKEFAQGNLIIGEAYNPSRDPDMGGRAPLLFFDGSGHLLTVSGSGGGKSVSVAMPNCINWQGSLVVHDPKGELARKCAAHRRGLGSGRRVAILNSGNPGIPNTDSLNVLDWLSPDDESVIDDSRLVASWLGPGEAPKDNGAYFHDEALKLIQILILYVLCSPAVRPESRNLLSVRKLFASPKLIELLKIIQAKGEKFCFGVPSRMAGDFLSVIGAGAGPQWAGIRGYAANALAWLDTPTLANLVCGTGGENTYSVSDINSGDLDVFVCVSIVSSYETSPAARLIFGALLNTRFKHGSASGGHDCSKNILFLIDEMPLLGKLDVLERARDVGRSYGITLWGIVQSLGQLKNCYGEAGVTNWQSSCHVQTYFGIRDLETAKSLSERTGSATVEYETGSQSTSTNRGAADLFGNTGKGNTITTVKHSRPLMTPDEIMTMKSGDKNSKVIASEQLVFVGGKKPLRCGLAKYYFREEWASFWKK